MIRLVAFVLGLSLMQGPAFAEHADPLLTVISQHAGDVSVATEGDTTVLSIRQHGIGRASITREKKEWPDVILVRAYFRGLESLKITSGDQVWKVSVLSHGKHEATQQLVVNGKEGGPLKDGSPYFTTIRRLGADAAPVEGLPPAGGYFEIRVPRALLKEAKEVKLEWIDFYR